MSLNGEQAQKARANVEKYLDTIDLMPYIEKHKGKTLEDMMDELRQKYPYKDEYSTFLFDLISEGRFAKYLNKRYNLKIKETTVSYFYI